MADVGAAAGVSDRTVSNVLSGKVPVRPATRQAVLRAVEELGYQMNVFARSLRTRQTGFITLAIPDLRIDYFTELAHSVLHEAAQIGWTVTLQQTHSRPERELAILTGADRQLSDGLIFQPHAMGPEDCVLTDQPMVLIGEKMYDGPVDYLTMDNVAASAAATRHLLQLGRRRIAVIGPDRTDTRVTAASLRLQGYAQALREAGIPLRQEFIGQALRWRQADGVEAIEWFLAQGTEFDGLFCFNDTLAFGALHALSRQGLRVPQDVAVIGFDNVPAAAYANPPLTTIDPGGPHIARQAVKLLEARVREGYEGTASAHVAGFRLVQRDSA